MKLCCPSEVAVETHELICRESRLAGVVRFIFWCSILAIAVIVGWQFGNPWLMWPARILFIVMIPLMLKDVVAQFRGTNWVLRISSNGVWINLTSYRDKVSDRVSVVWLDYREIASAGRHTESYTTPSEMTGTGSASQGSISGDTSWHDVFLEIRLNHEQTSELQAVLSNVRSQAASVQGPTEQSLLPRQHFPVWLVEPAVLRITWTSGHGIVVGPRIVKALARLETNIPLAGPTQRKRPNWTKLAVHDRDELARELVHVHGARWEAVALLVRGGNIPYAEANALVQRFEEEGIR
ncbi:MAG: hypothetical protein JWM11_1020 [Planctomycetaceae bacterium]|nr:hypothetical protein [Planctomycetaceae bacterium]